METEEEVFEVNGSTDLPTSNLLEKGRYRFIVSEIKNFVSQAGNPCAKVTLDIAGKKIFDNLMLSGKMDWKWKQFLYSIGIRNKSKNFQVAKSNIIDKKGLVDVKIKDRTIDDGTIIKENSISGYYPIEEEVAPIKGVEPEEDTSFPSQDNNSDDDL